LHLVIKLSCDERFTHAFIAFGCVFKEITLVGFFGNYFENATACSKRTLKTTVAAHLYVAKIEGDFVLHERNRYNRD